MDCKAPESIVTKSAFEKEFQRKGVEIIGLFEQDWANDCDIFEGF